MPPSINYSFRTNFSQTFTLKYFLHLRWNIFSRRRLGMGKQWSMDETMSWFRWIKSVSLIFFKFLVTTSQYISTNRVKLIQKIMQNEVSEQDQRHKLYFDKFLRNNQSWYSQKPVYQPGAGRGRNWRMSWNQRRRKESEDVPEEADVFCTRQPGQRPGWGGQEFGEYFEVRNYMHYQL